MAGNFPAVLSCSFGLRETQGSVAWRKRIRKEAKGFGACESIHGLTWSGLEPNLVQLGSFTGNWIGLGESCENVNWSFVPSKRFSRSICQLEFGACRERERESIVLERASLSSEDKSALPRVWMFLHFVFGSPRFGFEMNFWATENCLYPQLVSSWSPELIRLRILCSDWIGVSRVSKLGLYLVAQKDCVLKVRSHWLLEYVNFRVLFFGIGYNACYLFACGLDCSCVNPVQAIPLEEVKFETYDLQIPYKHRYCWVWLNYHNDGGLPAGIVGTWISSKSSEKKVSLSCRLWFEEDRVYVDVACTDKRNAYIASCWRS